MGTIFTRPRKDGTIGYTAQIKLRRGGKVVHNEARTFAREAAAKAWMEKREAELAKPGAIGKVKPPLTLSDAIDRYVKETRKDIGKTKSQVLEALKEDELGTRPIVDLTSADYVSLARRLGETRQPQTVQNYLSHLGAVLRVAGPAWGAEIDRNAMADAMLAAKRMGLVSKSRQRDRRPTLDELDRLMMHFADRSKRRNPLPMHRIIAFAVYSSRRQEEIIRIRWEDLEPGRVLVRDMKNPGEKAGNDIWCDLVPEAQRIAQAMPKTAPEIFPFTTSAISAAFTRACKLLAIEDLTFHDLRHEAASRLFEMGWTIPKVASVTGHRTWQSLQRYSHLRQTGDKLAGWKWLSIAASSENSHADP